MVEKRCAHLLVIGVLLLEGCVTTPAKWEPSIPVSNYVENDSLPADPTTEKIDSPDGEWVAPLNEGDCWDEKGKLVTDAPKPCPPKGGILFSEGKATRFKLFELRYHELRGNYVVDRRVFGAQRALYESRLKDAGELIQKMQPTWFERHSFQLGILGGAVIGAGMAVGIVYAVSPVLK